MKLIECTKYLLVLAALTMAGCGKKSSGLTLIPAEGTVTLDNKPLSGASLTLIPQGSGKGGYGVTDNEGRFSLRISPEESGVVAGKYMVLFSKYTMPDGSPIPATMSAADAGMNNALPGRYADPRTSDVYVDFPPASDQPLVIGLRSKGR